MDGMVCRVKIISCFIPLITVCGHEWMCLRTFMHVHAHECINVGYGVLVEVGERFPGVGSLSTN